MGRVTTGCAWCVALCVLLTCTLARAIELPELAEQTRPSVVHLRVLDTGDREIASGTGFFIGDNRVATNQHVISKAVNIVAKLSDGRELPVAGWLAADRDKDLAIIEVVGDDLPPPLPLGDSHKLRQGDEVVVIGSPRGLAGSLSTGIVSALRGEGIDGGAHDERSAKSWEIQITAAIAPGSSGSPIMMRSDGKVVAVAVGIVGQSAGLGFGVPIHEVKAMVDGLAPDAAPKPFATDSPVARNLIISGVFFACIAIVFFAAGPIRRRLAKARRSKRS